MELKEIVLYSLIAAFAFTLIYEFQYAYYTYKLYEINMPEVIQVFIVSFVIIFVILLVINFIYQRLKTQK